MAGLRTRPAKHMACKAPAADPLAGAQRAPAQGRPWSSRRSLSLPATLASLPLRAVSFVSVQLPQLCLPRVPGGFRQLHPIGSVVGRERSPAGHRSRALRCATAAQTGPLRKGEYLQWAAGTTIQPAGALRSGQGLCRDRSCVAG